jgi:hypothetical protein
MRSGFRGRSPGGSRAAAEAFLLLLDLTGGTFLRLEGGRSILKELLLPAIEDGGLQSIFLTQFGISGWSRGKRKPSLASIGRIRWKGIGD